MNKKLMSEQDIRTNFITPHLWNQRAENEYAWRVALAEIKARNYNLDIKNPHTEEDNHGDPAKLLSHYQERLRLVAELRAELKAELEAVLRR